VAEGRQSYTLTLGALLVASVAYTLQQTIDRKSVV